MRPARLNNYLFLLASTAVFSLTTVIAFNATVDPFRMYNTISVPGFNRYKPMVYTRVRLLKAYEIRRAKPDSILLGTSRCHLGIRPSHEGWAKFSQKRYNAAFDGATTKEMFYYLLHAHTVHPLKLVILGLDTYHPTEAAATARPDFDPSLLAKPPRLLEGIRRISADFKILTSLDTLVNSYKTWRSQNSAEKDWLASDGQRLGEVFFRRSSENFLKHGARAYFEEIDKLEVKFKLEGKIPAPPEKKIYPPKDQKKDPISSLGYIRKIIAFCRKENIALRIFLTPSHAHQLELSAATGEWPSIENAKRALVEILDQDASLHPGTPPIPLFDFSTYSDITTEPLPPEGSRAEMQYYWDSSHFKENVGDIVLNRILGQADSHSAADMDFGVFLTRENIEEHLADIRKKQERYRLRHPQDVAFIAEIAREFKINNNIKD